MLIAACLVLTKSRRSYLAVLCRAGAGGPCPRRTESSTGLEIARRHRLGRGRPAWPARGRRGCRRGVLAAKAAKSFGYRLQYWQATMRMIAEHPLAGCGPGNFQDAYTAYKLPEASEEVADPHNFLLEVWATAGTRGHAGAAGPVGQLRLGRVATELGVG